MTNKWILKYDLTNNHKFNEINLSMAIVKNEIIIIKNKIKEYENDVKNNAYISKIDSDLLELLLMDINIFICEFEIFIDQFIKRINNSFIYPEIYGYIINGEAYKTNYNIGDIIYQIKLKRIDIMYNTEIIKINEYYKNINSLFLKYNDIFGMKN